MDIDERPAIVERKARLGDWELDTIVGAQHRGALVSMAERRSKLVRLALVRSCKADEVARAIARHADFGRALQADTFFAKPYQAWQRGLNEHSNGLVRQYFPKSIDFTTVSSDDVRQVEALLNTRPRAVLVSLIDRFVEQLSAGFHAASCSCWYHFLTAVRGQLAGIYPEQWSKMLAYILVGKCALDEKEQQQDVQESLHAWIGESQRCGAFWLSVMGFCMSWKEASPMKQS